MFIDSHCHLDFSDYDGDREDVIERARLAGVKLMVTISTKITEIEKIITLADSYEDVVCSVGIHPHESMTEPKIDAAELIQWTEHPKVVAIGETGLDYFYEHSSASIQKRSFQEHIIAARETELPLIVHARDADKEIAKMLQEEMDKGKYPALIHCFTAGSELAEHVLNMGCYISISGIVTFKNAKQLGEIIQTIPLDRLLLETDAPFLAPVPHRGKRNEPSFIQYTAMKVAELKGITVEELAQITTENFFRLFQKISQDVVK